MAGCALHEVRITRFKFAFGTSSPMLNCQVSLQKCMIASCKNDIVGCSKCLFFALKWSTWCVLSGNGANFGMVSCTKMHSLCAIKFTYSPAPPSVRCRAALFWARAWGQSRLSKSRLNVTEELNGWSTSNRAISWSDGSSRSRKCWSLLAPLLTHVSWRQSAHVKY